MSPTTIFKRRVPPVHSNIFHCCIQKSASQWLKGILSSNEILRASGMTVHDPGRDFILSRRNRTLLADGFPPGTIVTPLYIPGDVFKSIPKHHPDWKCFWVMRDPRDMVVSRYFSNRYSHELRNPDLARERCELEALPFDEGLARMIRELGGRTAELPRALDSWVEMDRDPRVMLVRYEDLAGKSGIETMKSILEHCGIPLSRRALKNLWKRNSFQRLSGGRVRGKADPRHHYRRGVAGDWRNHFTPAHCRLFRETSGDLLQRLGYEKTADWQPS